MERLSDKELDAFYAESHKRTRLCCDEYHAHSLKCLVGPRKDLLIMRLILHIQWTRRKIATLKEET